MSPSTFQLHSTNTKVSSLNQSQKVKPFCKVCFDTGKTIEMYNSHFVRESRDPNSRILCPTLLALECRYCFVRGHTVSKCPKLENAKSRVSVNVPIKVQNRISRCTDDQSACSNGFSLLYSSDDEAVDDDVLTTSVTECSSVFECLNKSYLDSVNEVSNKTYAAALMAILKPNKPVVVMDLADDVSCISTVSGFSVDDSNHYVSSIEDVKVDLHKIFATNKKYSVPGSWADSDSDDEA